MHGYELYNSTIDGQKPYDGVPEKVVDTVARPLIAVIVFLAMAGVVFALVCLSFNIACRKTRQVVRE